MTPTLKRIIEIATEQSAGWEMKIENLLEQERDILMENVKKLKVEEDTTFSTAGVKPRTWNTALNDVIDLIEKQT